MFYNTNDDTTYSTTPFFTTSANILKQSNENLATWTVNMLETPDIPNYYGIPNTNTTVFYFYNRAPVVFKFDHMEKTKQPIDVWMKNVRRKADNIKVVNDENDLDVFENSNRLIFMIVDEEQKDIAEMMAAVAFNYSDMQFSYMLRTDKTMAIEEEINEQYAFSGPDEGSKVISQSNREKVVLIIRSDH